MKELENVATANALQLEVARGRAVAIRFNFVARVKFDLALPIRCRLGTTLLLIKATLTIVGEVFIFYL